MKEIQEILKKIESLQPNEKAILATVVDVQGSSYRLPGAKMLILENGETFGTVSGGCLEADILERAKKVLETGEPQVFVYDTTNEQDSVFSLNMGCRGVIRILLEPIDKESQIVKTSAKDIEYWVATLISNNQEEKIGAKVIYDNINLFKSRGFSNNLKTLEKIKRELIDFLDKQNAAEVREYRMDDEKIEVFFEKFSFPTMLTIFGAGADVIPLTIIAKNLGWNVTVVDHREKIATKERFPEADRILIVRPEHICTNHISWNNSVFVLMTHNYEFDREILRLFLTRDAKYIGTLGPKRRIENILSEFSTEGLEFSDNTLQKLYSPIGLDIGADTPEAIALAIVAEIQAVLKNREGGFLRNRKGSIYGRN